MSSFNMWRTIHPVGQGAFYSEIFHFDESSEKLVVYDCGSTAKNKLKKVITNALPQGKDIDILFISHFDSDHVNGLKELSLHHNIRNVVVPQYDNYEWYFGLVAGRGKYTDVITPISSLNTHVIQVTRQKDRDPEVKDNPLDFSKDEAIKEIESGVTIGIYNTAKLLWIYKPINFFDTTIMKELEDEIDIRMSGFKEMGPSEKVKYVSENRTEINKIYNRVFRDASTKQTGANSASLCLYSGAYSPTDENHTKVLYNSMAPYLCTSCCPYHFFSTESEGCLYTGDADLNGKLNNIKSSLANYYNRIGCFQIPHHGSNCNIDIKEYCELFQRRIRCFVCYGTRNRFCHPFRYNLNRILTLGSWIFEVTEYLNSGYGEYIECK